MKVAKIIGPAVCLLILGCAGKGFLNNKPPVIAGPTTDVAMTGNHRFDPTTLTVAAGTNVRWRNVDQSNHTVASDSNVPNFNSDPHFPAGVPASSSFVWTVPADAVSGTTYYYHCELHGSAGDGSHIGRGMAGAIVVQ